MGDRNELNAIRLRALASIEQKGQCSAAARVARDARASRSSEIGSPTAAAPRRCGSLRGLGHAAADRARQHKDDVERA
jgi:hypothetical protein